jgi:hypothetical protein
VRVKNKKGQMGWHAARSPHMVRECFAHPHPQAVMLCEIDIRVDDDDAQVGPWIGARMSTVVKNRPPRLVRTDRPSDCQALAPEQWSPTLTGRLRSRQGGHAPPDGLTALLCARPSRAAMPRPGATPMVLQLRWGLGSDRATVGYGIPQPHLVVACCAAVGSNHVGVEPSFALSTLSKNVRSSKYRNATTVYR